MSHICANDEYRYQVGTTNKIYKFFTGLSLRLRADISKVTVHERIQNLYLAILQKFQ
jgi:hypothetical protein